MVFSRLGGVDYAPGEAFALALPLFAVAAGLLVFERRAAGRRSFAVLGLRSREVPDLRLGRWRPVAIVFTAAAALVPMVPVGALAIRAARDHGFSDLPQWIGASAWNSLFDAFIAATLVLALSVVIGHAAARGRRGGGGLDALAVLAFVTPASVLGVGLIATWNRPSLQGIYGTSAIVALAFAARYGAVGLRTAAGSEHYEEAAAVSGAASSAGSAGSSYRSTRAGSSRRCSSPSSSASGTSRRRSCSIRRARNRSPFGSSRSRPAGPSRSWRRCRAFRWR